LALVQFPEITNVNTEQKDGRSRLTVIKNDLVALIVVSCDADIASGTSGDGLGASATRSVEVID
jgi:hypothetical protein